MAHKTTQREIRYEVKRGIDLVAAYKDGEYCGCSAAWREYVDNLSLDFVAYSEGRYGVNGLLFWSNLLRRYCGVVGRPSMMYTLPWS